MKTSNAAILFDEYGETTMTADQIILPEDDREPTGLLDQHGKPILRERRRIKFGFVGRAQ